MTRNEKDPASSAPRAVHPSQPEPHADDRWLTDLRNDLGAFSLSSDEIPVHQRSEMEFEEDENAPKPCHAEIGI